MDKEQAKERIEKLKKTINHHRHLYHVLDKQEISDSALDSLKKELFDLEQNFPDLVTADSPTQRVGGKPLKEFKKFKHPKRMLSFNDAFSEKDMQDWQTRFMRLLSEADLPLQEGKQKIEYYCELKIDGLAVELIYNNNGFLETGSTRGDGTTGEDVTENLKTIEAIPLKIDLSAWVGEKKQIIARGEVFISKKEFERINKEQKEKELPVYANPRNIAAGSVRQLDSKITALRKLDSFMYGLETDFGQKTHEDAHKILKNLGFKTSNKYNKLCHNLEEVVKFREYWIKEREKLGFEIDGIVVTVNDNKIYEKLGVVGKAPRGAIAFKFPQAEAVTKVLDIKVQVGRTGAMTPVAILKPVQVTGITISRATLHNEDEIKRLGVKIGDTVVVGRAGDVIPDIIKVLPELRAGKEKNFKMPDKCPSCGAKLSVKGGSASGGEKILRCPNKNCFAQKRRGFYHFASRSAFNFDGLGPKIIDRLLDEGLVEDPADLFDLKEGDIKNLERFAEKSAENLINSIQARREIDLSRLIYALGIRNVGEKTAIDLAKHFGLIKKIKDAKLEEIDEIKNIGPVVAKSIFSWFQDKENIKHLQKLENVVKIKNLKLEIKNKSQNTKVSGKTFVLTGGLKGMARDQAKAKIRELGGEISESVSSKTDYVIAGSEAGSKLDKAKKLGVKVLSEKEFLNFLK